MFWLPVAGVALLAGGAAYRHRKKKIRKMTPRETEIYQKAFKTLQDPDKLKALAAKYEKNGFKHEAEMLRKRAGLRALPPDVKKARRAGFQKAMKSQDKTKILKLADLFYKEGAIGAATTLRERAKGLILPQDTPK